MSVETVTFNMVDHQHNPTVRRGIRLDDPYLEACWMHRIGPTSVAVLRLVAHLTAADPCVTVDASEFMLRLGIGPTPFRRAMLRLGQYGFIAQRTHRPGHLWFDVPQQVPILSARNLDLAPQAVVDLHHALTKGLRYAR